MPYICIECGAATEYKELMKNKMKCTVCSVKRNNIWIKSRPEDRQKEVIAR